MAGRPGSRGGGLTGLHYGLFAFVFVSVLLLGVTIFLATQISQYQEAAAQAQRQLDDFGRPDSYFRDEANARGTTVANVMESQLGGYGQLVVGDEEAIYPTVQSRINRTLDDVATAHEGVISRGSALLRTTERLSALLAERRQQAESLSQRVAALEAQNADLMRQRDTLAADYREQISLVREDYRQTEQRYNESISEKEEQRQQLQSRLERTQQELQDLRVRLSSGENVKDEEIQRLTQQINQLREQIAAFEDPGLDPQAILTKADGRVLRAVPGSDVVYISLGEKDGVKIGMGFEVFSQTEAPRGIRGKASIEVATVLYETAECLVTRSTATRPIIEGDPIVNIAFEREYQPRFVVRGDFDLNYDGIPDDNGRQQVRAMIEQWGGQIVDELDENTEYLVVGTAPFVPALRPGQQATPTIIAQIEERRLQRSEFKDLIQDARQMFIPVMTQTQFLFLIGDPREGVVYP